LLGKLKQLL